MSGLKLTSSKPSCGTTSWFYTARHGRHQLICSSENGLQMMPAHSRLVVTRVGSVIKKKKRRSAALPPSSQHDHSMVMYSIQINHSRPAAGCTFKKITQHIRDHELRKWCSLVLSFCLLYFLSKCLRQEKDNPLNFIFSVKTFKAQQILLSATSICLRANMNLEVQSFLGRFILLMLHRDLGEWLLAWEGIEFKEVWLSSAELFDLTSSGFLPHPACHRRQKRSVCSDPCALCPASFPAGRVPTCKASIHQHENHSSRQIAFTQV